MVLNILLPFLNFYDKHSDFQKQFNMYIYNWITLLYNWNNIQSKQTLWDPMDCSPPDSSVHEILWARILEWVAIPFSRGYSWPRDQTQVSCNAGSFFTVWATREAQINCIPIKKKKTTTTACKAVAAHIPVCSLRLVSYPREWQCLTCYTLIFFLFGCALWLVGF